LVQLERIVQPTILDFEAASAVCYARFPYQRGLDSPERFAGFQKLGVELAVMRGADGDFQCVCFLLPSEITIAGETLRWYYMFQVANLPTAAGAGGLLIRRVMQWIPSIFGMGITPDAETLYKAFRWKPFSGFWRGVHPVNLSKMIEDYGARIDKPWKRTVLEAGSGLYNAVSVPAEWLLSGGGVANAWDGKTWDGGNCDNKDGEQDKRTARGEAKSAILGTYLPLFESGGLRAADVGGAGRLLTPVGAGSFSDHVALWRALRVRGAKFCETLLHSREACRSAKRLGYLPIELQVYCWDKGGVLERAIPELRRRNFTFLDTDKTV
jgi:hypothetical protein